MFYFKFINVVWPNNLETLYHTDYHVLYNLEVYSLNPKLTDIEKLHGKFYEFDISPFILNNIGLLLVYLFIFLVINLLTLMIAKITQLN